MPDVPIGYLITVALMASFTAFALAPHRPRQSSHSNISYWFGYLLNEQPFIAYCYLLASTTLAFAQGDVNSPGGWATFGLAMLTMGGLGVVAWRGHRSGPAVEHAVQASACSPQGNCIK